MPLTRHHLFSKQSPTRWDKASVELERVEGIEPSSTAWKAVALPLSYTRVTGIPCSNRNCDLRVRNTALYPLS